MIKKNPSVLSRPRGKTPVPVDAPVQQAARPPGTMPRALFSGLLLLGLIIFLVVSPLAWGWLRNIKFPGGNPVSTQSPTVALKIERTAPYAGLDYTIVNAQYQTSFVDDPIHTSAGVVRLNMIVANKSRDQISVIYYDIARLLAPQRSLIAPTNVSLSVGPRPGTSESGWIDFSVPGMLQLTPLKLQLGSPILGETLVTIPFTGSFDARQYSDRTSQQYQEIDYYFPYYNRHLLIYTLTSVDIRYSYHGSQVKAGQQYYVLNFRVDNPNSDTISPGFGYDYIRLSFNGGPFFPPIDNTLPYGFGAGVKGVGGHVVFMGPAGQHSFTLDFLVQYGSGGSSYTVVL